jgi:hypothetical protein
VVQKRRFWRSLYFQVLVALALGVLVGWLFPAAGASLKPLGITVTVHSGIKVTVHSMALPGEDLPIDGSFAAPVSKLLHCHELPHHFARTMKHARDR